MPRGRMMNNKTLAVCLTVSLITCAGLLFAQTSPTVSPPPTLTPIDPTPTLAMVAAAQANNDSLWAWTKDNLVKVGAKVDQISAAESLEVGETLNLTNRVDALEKRAPIPGPIGPQGVPGIQGIQGVPGPQGQAGGSISCSQPIPVGYVLHIVIPWMNGASVFPTITQSSGSSTAAKLYFASGGRYDYFSCIPAAGNYLLRIRSSISVINTGAYGLHLESNQVNVGSVKISQTSGGAWAMDSISITLPAGPQILTLVVDAKGTADLQGDWFELVKQ